MSLAARAGLFYFLALCGCTPPTPSTTVTANPSENRTVYYAVKTTKWDLPFIRDSGVSGPFEILSDSKFLFISRCGTVSFVARLSMALDRQYDLPHKSDIYCGAKDDAPFAGVKGSAIDRPAKTLYLSHHYEQKLGCIGMAITAYYISQHSRRIENPRIIFKTSDCVSSEIAIFTQGAGALALDDDSNLLFSVGDMGSPKLSQDEQSDFGKIYKFDQKTRAVSRYALGTRNAQGLAWNEKEGVLIATEQGPMGGDEINFVQRGDNLGWPISSYGIQYTHNGSGHYDGNLGQHDFGKRPAISFIPAIAPTDILVYPKFREFGNWAGDAIFVALRAQSFFRARIEGGRIMYVEPLIKVDGRLRFVRVDSRGFLYAKADPDKLIELRPTQYRRSAPRLH